MLGFNAFVCGLCLADFVADLKFRNIYWASYVILFFATLSGAVWWALANG